MSNNFEQFESKVPEATTSSLYDRISGTEAEASEYMTIVRNAARLNSPNSAHLPELIITEDNANMPSGSIIVRREQVITNRTALPEALPDHDTAANPAGEGAIGAAARPRLDDKTDGGNQQRPAENRRQFQVPPTVPPLDNVQMLPALPDVDLDLLAELLNEGPAGGQEQLSAAADMSRLVRLTDVSLELVSQLKQIGSRLSKSLDFGNPEMLKQAKDQAIELAIGLSREERAQLVRALGSSSNETTRYLGAIIGTIRN